MPQNRPPLSPAHRSRASVPPATGLPRASSSGRAYTVLDTTQLLHAVWLSVARQAAPERVHLDFRSSGRKHH